MSELPEPLTSLDCDLRDFSFMPVDIIRLFGSRFHAIADDAEWRAGLTLWLKSFHQVPAASVPDDDIELARLAELGRDVKAWKKVREIALHGWVKCADGRYYHPVVAEKALEAFKRKEFYRDRSKKANAARWGGGDTPDEPRSGGAEQKGEQSPPKRADQGQHEASKKETLKDSNERPKSSPSRNASSNPSASQGTVIVRGIEEEPPTPNGSRFAAERPEVRKVLDEGDFTVVPADKHLVFEWLSLPNMELDRDILPIIKRASRDEMARRGRKPFTLKFFDSRIREQHAADEAEIARLRKATRQIEEQDRRQREEDAA